MARGVYPKSTQKEGRTKGHASRMGGAPPLSPLATRAVW